MYRECEIGVVGGGLAGASLAAALSESGSSVTLIESVAPRSAAAVQDIRGLALSLASVRILSGMGVWDAIAPSANPIRHVHVSDRNGFGIVRMDAAMLDLDALGQVAPASEIGAALWERCTSSPNITLLCPARVSTIRSAPDAVYLEVFKEGAVERLACRLLVIADGTESTLRDQLGFTVSRRDYGQTAVVANVTTEHAHADTAYERFTDSGPVAFLPLPGARCSSVMCVRSTDAARVRELDDAAWLELLSRRFGRRLGALSEPGRRQSYALYRVQADAQVRGRALLLGNSAHTLHPNGAQGFNLALRDVAELAQRLVDLRPGGGDPGDASLLQDYVNARAPDQRRVLRFTEGLARTFVRRFPPAKFLRNAAMLLLDLTPPLKRELMRHGAGLGGARPRATFRREPV